MKEKARRDREHAAREDEDAPLRSSVLHAQRRATAQADDDAVPSRRNRNVDYARELFGLFIDVPWSAWGGYEHSAASDVQRGVVWDYNRDTKRFTIRFAPTDDWDCEDAGLTWADLFGEKPCLVRG